MMNAISEALLGRLSEFMATRTALHFPPPRWGDLERMARSASVEMGYADPESFIESLLSSPMTPERMEIVASHFTVGETYFWREPQAFAALEKRIFPELIRLRESCGKRMRLWCAGCSTGEEAYSIAIALRRALPVIDDWNIGVLATDINPRMLRKAAEGAYGEWSFRNAPRWLTEGFFRLRKDGKYEILPETRKMVTFEYLNLSEDVFPSPLNDTNAMDIVFCRNVLMYFSPESAHRIVEDLHDALVDGGWLIAGACEYSQFIFSGFLPVEFSGTIAYRKPRAAGIEIPRADASPAKERLAEAQAGPHASLVRAQAPKARGHAAFDRIASPDPPPSRAAISDLADRGMLSEALASCEAALAAERLDPQMHCLRAAILQELNRDSEAIASLKRAIYLDPNSIPAYFSLGNLALRGGDARMGRRCLENALALLALRADGDVLPEAGGMTARRLMQIISATMRIETSHMEAV